MGKKKQAKSAFNPKLNKTPKMDEALSRAYRNTRPVWSFQKHAKAGEFAWTSLESAHMSNVFNALASYEGMTWAQIENKDHCHSMGVEVCDKGVGTYLAQQGYDVDELFQLSTGSKGRLFGVRLEHVYQIIFWDPEHKIYQTEKKNT